MTRIKTSQLSENNYITLSNRINFNVPDHSFFSVDNDYLVVAIFCLLKVIAAVELLIGKTGVNQ